jgi:hypothetical protein
MGRDMLYVFPGVDGRMVYGNSEDRQQQQQQTTTTTTKETKTATVVIVMVIMNCMQKWPFRARAA